MYVDDAYERYEAFKQNQQNRLSIASSFEITPSPTVTSPTLSVAVSMSKADSSEGKFSDKLRDFLGRSKTPEERRSALTISGPISGPILTREPSPAASENPATFGAVSRDSGFATHAPTHLSKSWASLVDKSALDGIPLHERKRQEVCPRAPHGTHSVLIEQAIFELILTENSYVRDLQLVVEVQFVLVFYLDPNFANRTRQIYYSKTMPLLDEKAVKVVFANIEDILLTNTVRWCHRTADE